MDILDLLKGAALGAAVGAMASGVRSMGKRKNQRTPLPVEHHNMEALALDLCEYFQDFMEYKAVLSKEKQIIFQRYLNEAIRASERELAIEMMIEREEIVPNYRDYNDAERLALNAMEWLRAIEPLFEESPEMLRECREKGTQIAAQLSIHLNNIAVECSPRY